LTWVVVLGLSSGLLAAEPVAPTDSGKTVTIVTSAGRNEVRDYKVTFEISEVKPGSALPPAKVLFGIRHTYGVRVGEDLLPMELTLQKGQIITQGQALEITPSIYPRLTILLDTHFRVVDVLGASSSRFNQSTPGINYANMAILFYLLDADRPHAIGESWQGTVKLPSQAQTYDIVNTLNGLEIVDGVEAAKVTQQITSTAQQTGTPTPNMKCKAESYFATSNGRLLKSRAGCEVVLPPDGDDPNAQATKANARIDISVAK
jgi:hypothetical protein